MRECLLYDCFDGDLKVTASYATSSSATTETAVTVSDFWFLFEETDNKHDQI